MAFAQGIDFRNTSGFVTDPANCDVETASSANYPRTSAQGNTVGWEDNISGTRNRSAAVDARLAGVAFRVNGAAGSRYRIDLPAPGWYEITLAIGDQASGQTQGITLLDDTTVLSHVVGAYATSSGHFLDADCNDLTTAAWPAGKKTIKAFFSTTICRIKIGDTGGALNSSIAHIFVQDTTAPVVTAGGIDFRSTSVFTTDPAGCSPEVNPFAAYPHITAEGLVVGWEQSPSGSANRSAAVDGRLGGVHFVNRGAQSNYRVDLPRSGVYQIELAIGDQTAGQTSPAQRVELFDNTTSLGTIVNGLGISAGNFYDATGTLRTTAANWVSGEVALETTFGSTILRLLCGFPTGTGSATTIAHVKITQVPDLGVPFIGSATHVYTPAIVGDLALPFISSHTTIYTPALQGNIGVPFIASVTSLYPPTLDSGPAEVDVPFIASKTKVFGIFSLFGDRTYSGPGNGGEAFLIELAPNGTTETATLAADITADSTALELTGDGSLPSDNPFVVTIDDEVLYVVQVGPGSYRIRGRGVSNTTPASHTTGADVVWGDSYDMALLATGEIDTSFTADINSTGSVTYYGWLICFDSSQAYLSGDRYPMHVTEVLGVFDAGAGSTGSSRCDAAQPNAISVPTGVSDHCPAALSNPALITTDIVPGDVALIRYTNPEASDLVLGPRSAALQSWFGLKRVDSSDADVTLTDPDGYVVDTNPSGGGPGPFTGSVEIDADEPLALATGIAPDASDAAGHAIDTPNTVPWLTVTLAGTDRHFTFGSGGGGYDEKGWPMCCIAVRQGNRRIPRWESWDWRDYNYVYTGFGTDDTFAQLLINRNGIVFDSVPAVELPGQQDIDGPDAVWDDATYYFAAAWYVAIFGSPYLVAGPGIGGTPGGGSIPGGPGNAPVVVFPGGGGGPIISVPPTIEGGSGGDVTGEAGQGLFQAASV